MHRRLACIALLLVAASSDAARAEPAGEVQELFERKIRPVLEQRCVSCHGSAKHKAGLRLDYRDGILKGGESGPAIVPGKPDESVLIQALRHETVEMPPDGKLADAVIGDFVEWIRHGAPDPRQQPPAATQTAPDWPSVLAERRTWWSLQPVAESPPPATPSAAWSQQPVDRFLAAKLEAAGLEPGPPAEPRTLIRRLSFVLTGLPPAPDDVEAFVRDPSPEAYARIVDRLLAAPQFGECWARHWMDVVRFGETHGVEWNFEIGGAWQYRDYLIRAFNADLPFDQFVREHVAGDLLPQPRLNLALGLNESAIGPAFLQFGAVGHDDCYQFPELALEIIDNQIDVVSKAFQATTVSCARCHDHKIDAVSARDYYALHGILNSSYFACRQIDVPDLGREAQERLDALQPRLRSTLAELWHKDLDQLTEQMLAAAQKQADEQKAAAEATAKSGKKDNDKKDSGKKPARPADAWSEEGHLWQQLAGVPDDQFAARWSALAAEAAAERQKRRDKNPGTELPLLPASAETPWQVEGPGLTAGPTASGFLQLATEGDDAVVAVRLSGFYSDRYSQRSHAAWRLPFSRLDRGRAADRTHISLLVAGGGWAADRLVPDNCGLTEKTRFFRKTEGPHWITFAFDDGQKEPHRLLLELVGKAFNPRFPNREGMTPEIERDPRSWFSVLRAVLHDKDQKPLDDLAWLEPLLAGGHVENRRQLAERYRATAAESLTRWAAGAATDGDARWLGWLLRQGWLTNRAAASPALGALVQEHRRLEQTIPAVRTIQGLADLDAGADSRLLVRGNPRTPGEPVSRAYLEVLSPESKALSPGPACRTEQVPASRLELANRLADPRNPLTARVYVNRVWHWVFGAGIVRSTDDFGHVGERPSHPELLDYLAARFMHEGWSTRRLVRELVLSAAFQQASDRRGTAYEERDPDNLLLHRYPLRRLDAEAIRDLLLTVAGRLDPTMYGPSIEPFRDDPSPPRRIFAGSLDGGGRRSVYTRMTLMQEPPLLSIFNLPNGKFPQGRRDVTNVPAQALALLNDPFVRAMADAWAKRLLAQPAATSEQRLDAMFHTAFGRGMTDEERQRLVPAIGRLAELHQVSTSDCLHSEPLWTDVAHTLFNMKEFVYLR